MEMLCGRSKVRGFDNVIRKWAADDPFYKVYLSYFKRIRRVLAFSKPPSTLRKLATYSMPTKFDDR